MVFLRSKFGRILTLSTLWIIGPLSFAQSDVPVRTLHVLTHGFDDQTPESQQKILRHVGLLQFDEAISFLSSVALEEAYEEIVRREALKAFLALKSPDRFKAVLRPLSETPLQVTTIIDAFLEIDDPRLVSPLIETSISADLEERLCRKMILAVLSLWKDPASNTEDFALWKNTKAGEFLADIARTSSGVREKRAVRALGYVGDEKSFQALIRFLDSSNPELTAVAMEGLARGGERGAPALGRFLQKSATSELRIMAIEALGEIGGSAAIRALETYRSHAGSTSKSERDLVTRTLKKLAKSKE
jgi:HEAT repeat protein